MNRYPKITIITPSFNQGAYIEETIKSVIDQGYPNLEYIVMDGGSTDNTVKILKRYSDRITYWESKPDKGQTDAINKGLRIATGDIFNWLNSDDLLEKDALFKIGESFANADIDVLCGTVRYFDGEQGIIPHLTGKTVCYPEVERTIAFNSIGQPSHFYRMDVIRKLGALEPTFRYAMDKELWFRYVLEFGTSKVKMTEDVLSRFRYHDFSKTIAEGGDFIKDDNAIYYTLLKQAGAPDWLVNLYATPRTMAYNRQWNLTRINPRLLTGMFADKLATRFYSEGDYENAARCCALAWEMGVQRDVPFLMKNLKLRWMPVSLVRNLRRMKGILTG